MILPVPSYRDVLPKPAHRGAESRTQLDCKFCTSFTSPLYFLIFSTTCAMRSGLTVKRDIFSLPCHDSVLALGNWKQLSTRFVMGTNTKSESELQKSMPCWDFPLTSHIRSCARRCSCNIFGSAVDVFLMHVLILFCLKRVLGLINTNSYPRPPNLL